MSDEKQHSPENSPNTMGDKKRARRLNGRPLQIVFVVAGVLVLTLGLVMVKRSGREKANVAVNVVKSAAAYAKQLTIDGNGGVIDPAPTLPLLPLAPETPRTPIVEKPADDDKIQNPELPPPPAVAEGRPPERAKIPEEVRKLRDKRFRQVEAAIDGPIKVQLGDTRSQGGNAELSSLERQVALLGRQDAESYTERLAAIQAAGGAVGADFSKRDDLSRMNQFASEGRDWTNPDMPTAPPTTYIVRTGSVIPATLIGGINSDLPGQIVGQVAQNVYDTPTGNHLLIPQGSRLVGEYSSQVQYGQSRVFAVWQRIIFPDGKALDLGAMPGSSGAGYAGFKDRVNNHYVRIFGSAIMMSAILAGVEMTQDDGKNGDSQRMADALSEALGQQLGGTMAEMLNRNMSISPTLEIRPGYRLNVMLVKDLVFHGPYSGFDYARDGGR